MTRHGNNKMQPVGVIGLGALGRPVAGRILRARGILATMQPGTMLSI